MKTELNPGNSLLFLLQREYIKECKIEIEKDENGEFVTDQEGKTIEKAVHPKKLNFADWLRMNNLIIERSPILRPDSILKPLK
jgi:hypothetical protein